MADAHLLISTEIIPRSFRNGLNFSIKSDESKEKKAKKEVMKEVKSVELEKMENISDEETVEPKESDKTSKSTLEDSPKKVIYFKILLSVRRKKKFLGRRGRELKCP